MKFSTIFSGVLAAASAAAAAPATKRGTFDASGLNNLAFNSLDLGYLNVINTVDLQLLQQLAINNNLNAVAFSNVFTSGVFDVNAILQLQQLQVLLQLGQLGVFNTFDLSTLNLELLQLGLIGNVGSFDLSSLIDASVVPQITTIVQQGGVVISSKE